VTDWRPLPEFTQRNPLTVTIPVRQALQLADLREIIGEPGGPQQRIRAAGPR
jgi:hypothetical protein